MAMVVGLGAVFGRVPADQAWIVAGLLLVLPLALVVSEFLQWRRLMRRLNDMRAHARSRKKVIKKS